jgi:glycosyltransferase involved in cell wall biosynthesis
VIATDLGSRREIVRDGQTGLLYRSRDMQDLTSKVRRLISDRNLCATMGAAAREVYLAEYTPATNYETLIRIYEEAIDRNSRHARGYADTLSGSDAGEPEQSPELRVV